MDQRYLPKQPDINHVKQCAFYWYATKKTPHLLYVNQDSYNIFTPDTCELLTPEYVIRDWIYKMITQSDEVNTYEGIMEWLDEFVVDLEWKTETNFPMTMDIFTDNTKSQLEKRMGGEVISHVDNDLERHEKQKELLQSKGISEEPIILFMAPDGKYELGEGWHRTTQNFLQYPEGFIQPNVFIGLNAKWLDPNFQSK